jgi:hypothetical protein
VVKRTNFVLGMVALLVAGGCSDVPPEGDPAKRLRGELRGYRAPIGIMMGANETPYWAASAVSGFRKAEDDDVPAVIENLSTGGGCTFAKPKAEEFLAKVHVDSSYMKAPVYVASRLAMAERTKQYLENYKQGVDIVPLNIGDDQMGIVDVVVTETEKPVYLVLAYSSATIFNIQLKEGAKVSRIALVGFGPVAVANVDPSIPMRALNGSAMQLCDATPFREPADHWQFVRNAKEDSGLKDVLAKNYSYFSRFSRWYRESFGQPSEPNSIGASEASQVLVGPLPEALEDRVPFRSLEGATLVLSSNDFVHVGSGADYKQQMKDLIIADATRLAGGNLEMLKPTQ